MANYFNTLSLHDKLDQLGRCRFMSRDEFKDGCEFLKGKKVVIVGCGAQGLNQGLNMRDSGLDVSYALRKEAIEQKRASFQRATENGFKVGTYDELIPTADLVVNLTPDKQHSSVVKAVMPLMKQGAALGYSHGFNIVEVGEQIRPDITVVMNKYFPQYPIIKILNNGMLSKTLLILDDTDKNPLIVKVFTKHDYNEEDRKLLCGMLQTATVLCFNKMVELGIDPGYAEKLLQYGWETTSEALKHGGVTNLMDRLSNPAKIRAHELSVELKKIMKPLYQEHMDNIMSGVFSSTMMEDWANNDVNLLTWRKNFSETPFEKAASTDQHISEQEYFDKGILMVAMQKAGVELAFETMTSSGIKPESAYYESLHELPLIANTIARKRLYEMNVVISDTAEYGNYLFANKCIPLLADFMKTVTAEDIGAGLEKPNVAVDNATLVQVNEEIRNHPIEIVGKKLRGYMIDMKKIAVGTN